MALNSWYSMFFILVKWKIEKKWIIEGILYPSIYRIYADRVDSLVHNSSGSVWPVAK